MRLICIVLVIFIAPVALAQQELNSRNLGLAAIILSDDFDRRAHAVSRLIARDAQGWAELGEKDLRLAVVESELLELQRELDSIDLEQPFILSGPVRLKSYDLGRGGFPIASLLKSQSQPFANLDGGRQLPRHFTLMTANYGFADLWPVDRENAIEFLKSKTDDSGKTRPTAYLEWELRLVSYTQNRFIHAAIMKVRLYSDESKENLIFHLEEDRDLEKILGSSPLAEGITLKLPAINSFYIFGQRMLSPMRPVELASDECRELEEIGDHRTFLCEQALDYGGTNILMERQFVGGILVALDFRVTEAPPPIRADHLRYLFQRELGLAADAPVDLPHCWSFHKVSFRLEEFSLRAGDASSPFLRARAEDFPASLSDLDCSF